jgi:hypothetical protein
MYGVPYNRVSSSVWLLGRGSRSLCGCWRKEMPPGTANFLLGSEFRNAVPHLHGWPAHLTKSGYFQS